MSYEELDRQVKEKVDTLGLVYLSGDISEGGRGCLSPDRAKTVYMWGEDMTSVGRRLEGNITDGTNSTKKEIKGRQNKWRQDNPTR